MKLCKDFILRLSEDKLFSLVNYHFKRLKWYNRWQRPFYKALTLDLIRGCYNGRYSIYDIF